MSAKCPRSKRLCVIIALVLILVLILYTFFTILTIDDKRVLKHSTFAKPKNDYHLAMNSINPKTQVLLDWTLFFGEPLKTDFQLWPCRHLNCMLSPNRSLLGISRVVVFHLAEIKLDDLPTYRNPDQFYAVLSHESPPNTGHVDLRRAPKNYFNLTMTYRRDSSVYAPYSTFVRTKNNMTSSQLALGQQIIAGKRKLVAWFVSNCRTSGKREEYVEELKKHIPIDVYGKCGPLKCEDREKCRQMLSTDYKFYLAFENSHCQDYITEKFFYLFEPDLYVVPVVMMKRIYIDNAPPDSFISVDDFASPKHLADHLRRLDSDPISYAKFFAYKSDYGRSHCTLGKFCGFCRLCELAHMKDEAPHEVVEDLDAWWNAPGVCEPDLVPKLLDGGRGAAR